MRCYSPALRNAACWQVIAGALLFALSSGPAFSQPTAVPTNSSAAQLIDLPIVLRLAGARNLDVQIARERSNEARATHQATLEAFFPSLTAGLNYHRRDGMAQAVPAGTVSNTHFDSYAPGGTIAGQIALGEAIYQRLASRQLVKAAEHALEAQRQESLAAAAQAYFELAKFAAVAEVLREAVGISENYQQQLHDAVGAGIAFKGDELRVRTQTEGYRLSLSQALEQQRLAAVELSQILHLDSTVELAPQSGELAPILLFPTNAAMHSLVQRALRARPELSESEALLASAEETRHGAVYGPLAPTLSAQVFVGGFGGGHDHAPSNFGNSEDYLIGLGWRFGPGGLFDSARVRAAGARLAAADLSRTKLRDSITAEVVKASARVQSLAEQIDLARRNLATALEAYKLTHERKQYGVGIVLEDIQAQQEVTGVRTSYLSMIADFDRAQYALNRAVGGPPAPPP